MTYSTFEDLEASVANFNREHPRPHGQICLTDLLDISKEAQAAWPSNESPGVYIFLDANKQITYIGKASANSCIGARLNPRFDPKWNPRSHESQGCVYITTIALPRELAFEAPAIEEYLIRELSTRSNTIGASS